jgi:uncharacterized protein YndB with AHSA1/START domain
VGTATASVWIQAPPEDVWRIYVDPARIPDWQTGSPKIEDISGFPDEPGSTYVSRRSPGAAKTTVVESDPPRRLVTRTQAYYGLNFDVVSELTPEGDGTRLVLRTDTEWPPRRKLLGKLVELAILNPREVRKELALLKNLVEQAGFDPARR